MEEEWVPGRVTDPGNAVNTEVVGQGWGWALGVPRGAEDKKRLSGLPRRDGGAAAQKEE